MTMNSLVEVQLVFIEDQIHYLNEIFPVDFSQNEMCFFERQKEHDVSGLMMRIWEKRMKCFHLDPFETLRRKRIHVQVLQRERSSDDHGEHSHKDHHAVSE